jgi:hypothetical protein
VGQLELGGRRRDDPHHWLDTSAARFRHDGLFLRLPSLKAVADLGKERLREIAKDRLDAEPLRGVASEERQRRVMRTGLG